MNDRFKFRVWSQKYNMYLKDRTYPVGDSNFYISQDGEIVEDYGPVDEWDENPLNRFDNPDYIIEQCTGEKDQFGKIVFEGDIVDQYSPMEDCRRRCVVEWVSEAGGGYVCRYLDGKGNPCAHGNSEGTYFDGAYCVVVGNIHEVKA